MTSNPSRENSSITGSSDMAEMIWSTDERRLLHMIIRGNQIQNERSNVTPITEYLQIAVIHAGQKSFPAHRHLPIDRHLTGPTQECWIVLRGSVRVHYYDEEGQLIHMDELSAGDCTITFRGGHGYDVLEDGTLVFEIKTGPYGGRERDKVLL